MPSKRTKALDFSPHVKRAIWARDGERCIICGNREAMPSCHYIPRSHSGLGIEQNGVTLCREHHREYDQSTNRASIGETIRDYLLRHYPDWDESKLVYKKYEAP